MALATTANSLQNPNESSSGSKLKLKDAIMAVVFPSRRCRMALDVVCFILCFLVTAGQSALLDYYFLKYLNGNEWYAWVAGDVLVLGIMLWLLIVAIRYNQRCMEEVCVSDANIRYAFFAWFAYSAVLAGKVAVTFRLYQDDIPVVMGVSDTTTLVSADGSGEIFGRHCYKLALSLAAIIFLLLVESHHYTQLNSPRQLYLTYLATNVTLDILDSIYFLELLWNDPANTVIRENFPLEISILVLACFNFILPTFALLKLRFRKFPGWCPLPYPVLYSLFYVLLVNVPYLVVRVFVWVNKRDQDVSIFLVKNAIMIYLGIREAWTRIQLRRQRKALISGSQGELTANVGVTMENDEKE